MAISGIGYPAAKVLGKYQANDDVVNVKSTEKAASVNSADVLKGKINICAGASCVLVNAGDVGLTRPQVNDFARAFHAFIVKNPGADLATSGTAVFGPARSGSKEDENFARVVAQFVGYNLPKGWNSTQVRTVIYAGSASALEMPNSTAGRLDRIWVKDRTPQTEYTLKLNMGWGDHRANPSGLARTMIHEYLHREDQLGFKGGRRVTEEHQQLDATARNLLHEYGLNGGGCQAVGESIFPWVSPDYPGCGNK